ncbi:MAG: diphthine synthase [Thermoplasmatota archaeon]
MAKLTLIGLGISDEGSIPLSGIEALRSADKVFAEFYTSILKEGSIRRLSGMIGKEIRILDRISLEDEELVINALDRYDHVCLLTAGDPLTATTHQEIRWDAIEKGFEVEIIHSTSIFVAAAGISGLQHYKFGRTTTIPYPEGNYFPTSPLEMIRENRDRGLHTLVLLDIKADESRYMTASEGFDILLRMEDKDGIGCLDENTHGIAVLRAGRDDWDVHFGEIGRLKDMDMGPPPHCIIIPGKLHFMEEEILKKFSI